MITIHDLKKPLRNKPSTYRVHTRVEGFAGNVHWKLTLWRSETLGHETIYSAKMSFGNEYEINGEQFKESAIDLITK